MAAGNSITFRITILTTERGAPLPKVVPVATGQRTAHRLGKAHGIRGSGGKCWAIASHGAI